MQYSVYSTDIQTLRNYIKETLYHVFVFSDNRFAALPGEAPSSHPVALYVILPISKLHSAFLISLCHNQSHVQSKRLF